MAFVCEVYINVIRCLLKKVAQCYLRSFLDLAQTSWYRQVDIERKKPYIQDSLLTSNEMPKT